MREMKAVKLTAEPMFRRARSMLMAVVVPIAQRGREVRSSTLWVVVSWGWGVGSDG